MENAYFNSSNLPTDTILPEKKEIQLTKSQIFSIVRALSDFLGNLPYPCVFTLIFLLFLRGASNKRTPDSLSVSIVYNTEKFSLQRGDFMTAYKTQCKNTYLRRMAEFLASQISSFAARYNLPGDLFNQVGLLFNRNEEPLSINERIWCSSLNQKNDECSRLFPRVSALLALEYRLKFQKKSSNIQEKKVNGPARQKGKNKGGKKPKGK